MRGGTDDFDINSFSTLLCGCSARAGTSLADSVATVAAVPLMRRLCAKREAYGMRVEESQMLMINSAHFPVT